MRRWLKYTDPRDDVGVYQYRDLKRQLGEECQKDPKWIDDLILELKNNIDPWREWNSNIEHEILDKLPNNVLQVIIDSLKQKIEELSQYIQELEEEKQNK